MSYFRLRSRVAASTRLVPVALMGLLLLSSCSKDEDTGMTTPPAPATIAFTQAGLYPEGVQYDAPNSRFLVTSLTTGRVGQVKDDGTYSTAFPDEPRLVSAIGMLLDAPRNRVLVAISDPGANQQRSTAATQGRLARLAIFNNANAAAAPTIVELGSLRPALGHFANDVAVDAQGNAYVTDSFANIIYKVDAQTNTPTVFLEDATRLAPPTGGAFGFNGIVFHPDGYLLVAKSDNGAIYKVPLNNPAGFTQVTTTQNLTAADGMLLQDNNTLQVVSNAQARVFRMASTNGFTSATLSGTFVTPPQFPTTLARRDDASYVLYANLNALFSSQMPAVSQYSINRVDFQ
ncbi:SMP-30/gluconolactonase/LRE family protein [Hymenobacter arizonensis]|uniref:SMP-30/Gluconolaconase/LRE-like region-containing protein n=1 Tax=Hymenobacter arizonensis TaxID=1227077 RepID=A0A1I5SMW1_HYMAR|nr:SMP-30/gluconolactonase/LRE family protein [Hymenobacter arizonensis]SFP72082.1 SMP-30/Gluconolaconase/LRE-like region-containing protein [Hymenobacter arizonensis]